MKRYDELTDDELLERLSDSPPDTPDWIKSNAEMQRRIATRRSERVISPPGIQTITLPSSEKIEHPKTADLTDPLRDVARKERRLLLTVSLVTLALVLGNLVPTQVESLGIKVAATERNSLLLLLGVANLYLLVTFAIYARVDILAWRADFNVYIREKAKALRKEVDASHDVETAEKLLYEWPLIRPYEVRAWFEFWPPLIISGITLLFVVARLLGLL